MTLRLEQAAAALVILLLLANQIFAGRSHDVMVVSAGLGLLLCAVVATMAITQGSFATLSRTLSIALGLGILVLVWVFVQAMLPMPEFLAYPGWSAAEAAGADAAQTISANPAASRIALLRMMLDLLLALSAYALAADVKLKRLILWAIIVIAAANAAYGIENHLSGTHDVLGQAIDPFVIGATGGHVTGTYVSRNEFAVAMAIGLIASGGALFLAWRRGGSRFRTGQTIFALMLGAIILAALAMSGSRGGMVAAMAGGAVFAVTRINSWPPRRRDLVILSLAGLLLLSAFVFVDPTALMRMARLEGDAQTRADIVTQSLVIAADFPWTGIGMGAFETVFPIYRTAEAGMGGTWNGVHNIYVEAVIGLGAPMALALFAAVALLMAAVFRRSRKAGSSDVWPCVALGAMAACLVSGLYDFSLMTPGISHVAFTLLGLAARPALPPGR